MTELPIASLLKFIPNAFSYITDSSSEYQKACLLAIDALKQDNKNLIRYAQKTAELASKYQNQNKKASEFYDETRGSNFLDEFITYHTYAKDISNTISDSIENKKSKVTGFKEEFKERLNNDLFKDEIEKNQELLKLINEYLEFNQTIREIIFVSRDSIRNKKDTDQLLDENDITALKNAKIEITNLALEFYTYKG